MCRRFPTLKNEMDEERCGFLCGTVNDFIQTILIGETGDFQSKGIVDSGVLYNPPRKRACRFYETAISSMVLAVLMDAVD